MSCRTISLLIAAATLSSNALSSLLFHQLPDDPYHISANFSSYLYFANLVSVLGLLGAFCVSPAIILSLNSLPRPCIVSVLICMLASLAATCSLRLNLLELPHPRHYPLRHPTNSRPLNALKHRQFLLRFPRCHRSILLGKRL